MNTYSEVCKMNGLTASETMQMERVRQHTNKDLERAMNFM